MSRAGFIAVPSQTITDENGNEREVPDLDAPAVTSRVERSPDGRFFYLSEGGDFLAFQRLGAISSRIVHFAVTNNPARALALIDRLGANAYSIQQALSNATFRNWLQNNTDLRGIRRVSDGVIAGILPPVVVCGQNPFELGVPNFSSEEEYELV